MQPSFPTETPCLPAPLSRKKRALFFILMVVGTYLIVEMLSFAVIQLHFRYGGWAAVQTAMAGAALENDGLPARVDLTDEVVHPYTGFVRQPLPASSDSEYAIGINDFGFKDRELPLHTRSRDKVIIGILGGSVAEQFGAAATKFLEEELKTSPPFAGKELIFVRLGLSGYKQPQQFLTVSYLLSLGGQFDILINLDGYNEIVLPIVENIPNHVFAAFPRGWQLRVNQDDDIAIRRAIGRISYLRERSQAWARVARTPPLCYSATAALAWRVHHDYARDDIFSAIRSLNKLKAEQSDYVISGPPRTFHDEEETYDYCAQLWKNSSLQLHRLCEANGILYYHFLQPNQYVPESKVARVSKVSKTWDEEHAGKIPVEKGYPRLIREGRSLTEAGVSFTDLTMIFRDHPEEMYKDACCHLNGRGNKLVAQKIAEVIRTHYPRHDSNVRPTD